MLKHCNNSYSESFLYCLLIFCAHQSCKDPVAVTLLVAVGSVQSVSRFAPSCHFEAPDQRETSQLPSLNLYVASGGVGVKLVPGMTSHVPCRCCGLSRPSCGGSSYQGAAFQAQLHGMSSPTCHGAVGCLKDYLACLAPS